MTPGPVSLPPPGLAVSIPGLERALQQYTLEPSEKPFDLKSVPLATAPVAEQRTGEPCLCPPEALGPRPPLEALPGPQGPRSCPGWTGPCWAQGVPRPPLPRERRPPAHRHSRGRPCPHSTRGGGEHTCERQRCGRRALAVSELWLTTCACSCRKHPGHRRQAAREGGRHPAGDLPG